MKGRNAKGGGDEPPPFALPARGGSRALLIDKVFLADLGYWIGAEPRIAAKVVALLVDVIRSPTEGIGKPEPLKHHLRGRWSRRITAEHRLIHRVHPDHVELISALRHYG